VSPFPVAATWFDGLDAAGRKAFVAPEAGGIAVELEDGGVRHLDPRAVHWLGPADAPRPLLACADGAQLMLPSCESARVLGVPFRGMTLAERAGRSRLAAFACAAGLAGLIALALAWFIPSSAELAKRHLPWQMEALLGEEVLRVLDASRLARSSLAEAPRERIRARFETLVQAADLQGTRLEFRAAPRMGPNAMALPGRIVVLSDELVALLGETDRLDAVLAHELGHLKHRHALGNIVRSSSYALILATVLHDQQILRNVARHVPDVLLRVVHSRDAERESDAFALVLLRKTGRSPEDFARAMEAFQRIPGRPAETESYFASHPATQERIDAARAAK
jgi:predicted Zn-dependent protease